MSILSQISKPADRPIIVTILGDAGMGKTSLAATFPAPVFIRAEDGLQAVPEEFRPDAFPVISSSEELYAQLGALIKEEHNYKTVVVDSVTALEQIFTAEVVASDPKNPRSINQALGGYGAGMAAVGAMHQRVRKAAGMLVERGINVVFIAHADTETIELPDQDPYTRYNLRLGKKSMAPYTDNVDIVAHVKLQTYTMGDGDRKKAISDGSRIVTCYATASAVCKNRYGITEDLPAPLGVNPFVPFVKVLQGA